MTGCVESTLGQPYGNKVVDVDRSEHDERGCDLMLICSKDNDNSDDGDVLAQSVTITYNRATSECGEQCGTQ